MPADRGALPEPTKRGLQRAVKVDADRMCFPHDWTRDDSLSHCLRYGHAARRSDGTEIDKRTMEVCAASAMDLLQDLVAMPARKREKFVRAIRAEMARKTGDAPREVGRG